MSHAHTRTKVSVRNTFRGNSFQQGTHNGVTSRIPTGRNNRHCVMSFRLGIQRAAQCRNTCMDVETIYCMNSQCQYFFGIFLNAASRGTKDCNIHILQLFNIFHYGILTQFCRTVLCSCTTHHSGDFKIGSCLQRLKYKMSDIAITNDGCSYFFHLFIGFSYQLSIL